MILGLSFSHNATACAVDAASGRTVFCCSEERFSRRKNEWGVPRRTLEHVFEHVAPPEDITTVAIGESCRLRYGTEQFGYVMNLADYATKDTYLKPKTRLLALAAKEMLARSIGAGKDLQDLVTTQLRALGLHGPVTFMDHHAAHAASAYYASPFDEALVMTLDGEGDGLSGSCWHGTGARLNPVLTHPESASVGLFYKSITSLLGFKVNQQEGKVTGLAAYGDPERFYPALRPFLGVNGSNCHLDIVSKAAERHLQRLSRRHVYFLRLLSHLPRLWKAEDWDGLLNDLLREEFRALYRHALGPWVEPDSFSTAADIAAAAQRIFEEAVLEIVRFCQRRVRCGNVVLAGGVFANVRLNQRILELPETEALYIHPGMGDEGLALGAALTRVHDCGERKLSAATLDHAFHGPAYENGEVRAALAKSGLRWWWADDETLGAIAAEALCGNAIVGLVRGRLEYGPRALGHRSILANPTDPGIQNRLNTRLKRSAFMPFAPALIEECFDDLFTGPNLGAARLPARFMTVALDVDPAWQARIPGVVHVDGTARPQILRHEDGIFYDIVRRFHEQTGIGCVLNTSFNLHEEPIINTPEEALRALDNGAIDLLVLGSHVAMSPHSVTRLPRTARTLARHLASASHPAA